MSGGGAGAPANTSTQVTTSNIPTYMQPYAKAMMGSAMSNVFNMDPKGNITSMKGYTPYGVNPALADAVTAAQQNPDLWNNSANTPAAQKAYNDAVLAQQQATQGVYGIDPATGQPVAGGAGGSAYVAGFSPMQQQAFQSAQGLQVPGQFGQATDYVNQAAQGSLGIAGLTPGLAQGAQGYGAQGAGYGAQGAAYGAQGAQAGQVGMGYGAQGAQAGQVGMQQAGQVAGQAGGQAGMYGLQGAGYGVDAASMAGQGYGAQRAYQRAATDPGAVQAYMNPYIQASLAPQLQLLSQQTGIQGAAQQAAATSSGAFGGTRSALQNALVQQAGNLAAQQAIGQGYNQAYQNAQQAMQYGAGLGIQGLQAGTAAQQAGMQGAQVGLQGVGQMINAGQLGLAGAQTGIQGAQAGMQGAGLGIQGAQTGIQGAQTGIQGAQTGIAGINAATAADQLGLQAYGQAGSQGVNLANIGNQQLAAQEGIIGLQNQLGGIQQQQGQNVINAAMGQYNTQQQYPYQQLSFLSNLIRGLPTQSTTTQGYQAAPSPLSTVAGLGTMAAGALMKKKGGIVDAAMAKALRG